MFVVVVTPEMNWALAVVARANSGTRKRRTDCIGELLRESMGREVQGGARQAAVPSRRRYEAGPLGQSGPGAALRQHDRDVIRERQGLRGSGRLSSPAG